MTSTKADLIERITNTVFRRVDVVAAMYRRFPPFPKERRRYDFLRARKAILEAGLAHLGNQLSQQP